MSAAAWCACSAPSWHCWVWLRRTRTGASQALCLQGLCSVCSSLSVCLLQGGPGHLYLLKNKVATFAKVEKEEDMIL